MITAFHERLLFLPLFLERSVQGEASSPHRGPQAGSRTPASQPWMHSAEEFVPKPSVRSINNICNPPCSSNVPELWLSTNLALLLCRIPGAEEQRL